MPCHSGPLEWGCGQGIVNCSGVQVGKLSFYVLTNVSKCHDPERDVSPGTLPKCSWEAHKQGMKLVSTPTPQQLVFRGKIDTDINFCYIKV